MHTSTKVQKFNKVAAARALDYLDKRDNKHAEKARSTAKRNAAAGFEAVLKRALTNM